MFKWENKHICKDTGIFFFLLYNCIKWEFDLNSSTEFSVYRWTLDQKRCNTRSICSCLLSLSEMIGLISVSERANPEQNGVISLWTFYFSILYIAFLLYSSGFQWRHVLPFNKICLRPTWLWTSKAHLKYL